LQVSHHSNVSPTILIDASLSDRVLVNALKLVDYYAVSCTEQFPEGTPDPMLIEWLGVQNGIWITADEKAKRQYADEIKSAKIHIVWVQRPKDGMNKRKQLLLLLWVIDPILEEIKNCNKPSHYLAKYSGIRPKYKRI